MLFPPKNDLGMVLEVVYVVCGLTSHSSFNYGTRNEALRSEEKYIIFEQSIYFTFFKEQFRGKHWHAHFSQAQAIGMHVLFNGPIILRGFLQQHISTSNLDFSRLIYSMPLSW